MKVKSKPLLLYALEVLPEIQTPAAAEAGGHDDHGALEDDDFEAGLEDELAKVLEAPTPTHATATVHRWII